MKGNKLISRNDLYLLCAILLLSVAGFSVVKFIDREPGVYVRITTDGREYGVYSLREDREVCVEQGQWHNTVVIRNGGVTVREANCPDRYCEGHMEIRETNSMIVCLPHRLVVEIVSKRSEEEPDAYTR